MSIEEVARGPATLRTREHGACDVVRCCGRWAPLVSRHPRNRPRPGRSDRWALCSDRVPPAAEHVAASSHTPADESYIVHEGSLTLQAGEQRVQLAAGAVAVVPMGVVHTFRVDSDCR